MESFENGSLVYLRPKKSYNAFRKCGSKIAAFANGEIAMVMKSLGKDPNDHEYFEVLVNDQVITAWDDELERRD